MTVMMRILTTAQRDRVGQQVLTVTGPKTAKVARVRMIMMAKKMMNHWDRHRKSTKTLHMNIGK
jgi:hypothetical protein